MSDQYQKAVAFRKRRLLIVALFLVVVFCGIAGYGFILKPPQLPENPPNIHLSSTGGDILFSHRHHYEDDGAAIGCEDCHHNYDPESEEKVEMNCRQCHYENQEIVEAVCAGDATHPRCVGTQCLICHDGEDCTFCHRKKP